MMVTVGTLIRARVSVFYSRQHAGVRTVIRLKLLVAFSASLPFTNTMYKHKFIKMPLFLLVHNADTSRLWVSW